MSQKNDFSRDQIWQFVGVIISFVLGLLSLISSSFSLSASRQRILIAIGIILISFALIFIYISGVKSKRSLLLKEKVGSGVMATLTLGVAIFILEPIIFPLPPHLIVKVTPTSMPTITRPTTTPKGTSTKSIPTATPTLGVTATPRLAPTPRSTPTFPPIKTPGVTPTTSVPCQAPCDAEFPDTGNPFTINGPAIVEWADPGCGIYELNAGKPFTWSSDGHYRLYPDQTSLDSAWPGHLQAYQSKRGNGSCIVGPPS